MLTASPKNRSGFLESDRIKSLDLPRDGHLPEIAQRLESGMKSDKIRDVGSACIEFLATASDFYGVPTCGVRVLAARPLRTRERGTFELFGDYTPDSMLIRVWMRTAVRKEVTSFDTFVCTLHSVTISISRSLDSRTRRIAGLLRKDGCAVRLCAGDTPEEIVLGSDSTWTLAD